jgi:hypothetical protein
MTKVVINNCYGGFSLSKEGMQRYCEIKNIPCWIEVDPKYSSFDIYTCWIVPEDERIESKEGEAFYQLSLEERQAYNEKYSSQTLYHRDIERDDPALVQLVEENAELYAGRCAQLAVVEIPDDVDWYVEEYDGNEWVAEAHRTWVNYE